MKNSVHADRLRKFNELESNDQQTGTLQEVCIFTGKTSQRHIDVTVKIDDVTTVSCDAIVHILISDVDDIRGASRAIMKAAGDEHRERCEQYVKQSGKQAPLCIKTWQGLTQTKYIVHALLSESDDSTDYRVTETELIEAIYQCLLTVDQMSDVSKIIIAPIAIQSVGMDQWTPSHAVVKAICKFDEQTADTPGKLKAVQFVNLSTTDADILCVVLRQLILQEHQETATPPDTLSQVPQEAEAEKLQQAPPSQASSWISIKGIMGHRRRRKGLFPSGLGRKLPAGLDREAIYYGCSA
jgi:O-acetyl-ADP-ribose deacetylase (regulator of RNase III)